MLSKLGYKHTGSSVTLNWPRTFSSSLPGLPNGKCNWKHFELIDRASQRGAELPTPAGPV